VQASRRSPASPARWSTGVGWAALRHGEESQVHLQTVQQTLPVSVAMDTTKK